MARQIGFIKIKGLLGEISFYRAVYGYLVRRKTGVDRTTVLKDPRFARTRENARDFGSAARAGKRLRSALAPVLANAKDTFMVQRLTALMLKILQSDTGHVRGERQVEQGDLRLLEGFDFNKEAPLDMWLMLPFEIKMDREKDEVSLGLETFVPSIDVRAPAGVDHFRLVFGVVVLGKEGSTYDSKVVQSEILAYVPVSLPALELTATIPKGEGRWVVMVVGVVFLQQASGGTPYEMLAATHNALRVVRVVPGW